MHHLLKPGTSRVDMSTRDRFLVWKIDAAVDSVNSLVARILWAVAVEAELETGQLLDSFGANGFPNLLLSSRPFLRDRGRQCRSSSGIGPGGRRRQCCRPSSLRELVDP